MRGSAPSCPRCLRSADDAEWAGVGGDRSLRLLGREAHDLRGYGNNLDVPFATERPWNRLLLGESLVRPGFVVEAHERVRGALRRNPSSGAPRPRADRGRTASAASRDRIRSGAPTAVRTMRVPTDTKTRRKRAPSFASRSETSTCGAPLMTALRACCAHHSSVGPAVRHRRVDDPASTQVDKEQHEDLAEPGIVGLHEVACPGDVIVQKARPALTVAE